MFGRQVSDRADEFVLTGQVALFAEEFDEAEVEHLDEVRITFAARQHDVAGFEIPVNDPKSVCFADGVEDLARDGREDIQWDVAHLFEQAIQADAVDVLHDDVADVVFLAEVVDTDDIGVVEQAQRLGFS